MNILIVTTQFPFISGGAEIHALNLTNKLLEFGYQAELVRLPVSFKNSNNAINEREAFKLLDLSIYGANSIDKIICLKYPAYFVHHPNKVLWLLHQQRELYDLWDTFKLDYQEHRIGEVERQKLIAEDALELKKFPTIFTNSQNVSKRLMNFCGIDSRPLYHPPENYEHFYFRLPENYFLFPGRISTLKRHDLILRAFSRIKGNSKLLIIGKADNTLIHEELLMSIERLGLSNKVKYLGYVTDEKKRELYAKCIAVLFPAKDEDYGYISLEAMFSSKPVITCSDSGGPLEFIDNDCGYVIPPDEESIAEKLEEVQNNISIAIEKGKKFHEKSKELNISWEHIIEKLICN